jgi:hypothetical protein
MGIFAALVVNFTGAAIALRPPLLIATVKVCSTSGVSRVAFKVHLEPRWVPRSVVAKQGAGKSSLVQSQEKAKGLLPLGSSGSTEAEASRTTNWSALMMSDPGPFKDALRGDPTAVRLMVLLVLTVAPANIAVSLTWSQQTISAELTLDQLIKHLEDGRI